MPFVGDPTRRHAGLRIGAVFAIFMAIAVTGCVGPSRIFIGVFGTPSDITQQRRILSETVRSSAVPIQVSIHCDRPWCREPVVNLAASLQRLGIQASDQVVSPLEDANSILLLIDREWNYWGSLITFPLFFGTFGFIPFLSADTYHARAFQLDSNRATIDPRATSVRIQPDSNSGSSQLRDAIARDDTGAFLAFAEVAVVASSSAQHQLRGWYSLYLPVGMIGSKGKSSYTEETSFSAKFDSSIVEKVAVEALIPLL